MNNKKAVFLGEFIVYLAYKGKQQGILSLTEDIILSPDKDIERLLDRFINDGFNSAYYRIPTDYKSPEDQLKYTLIREWMTLIKNQESNSKISKRVQEFIKAPLSVPVFNRDWFSGEGTFFHYLAAQGRYSQLLYKALLEAGKQVCSYAFGCQQDFCKCNLSSTEQVIDAYKKHLNQLRDKIENNIGAKVFSVGEILPLMKDEIINNQKVILQYIYLLSEKY